MNSRYKKLLGNSIVFAIGNFGSKIMQFIMVPLYSYTLSTSQFGRVDILTSMVNLLAPVVCLDIFDSVFRFILDKNDDKKVTLNTGFFFILAISAIVLPCGYVFDKFIHGYPIALTSYLLIFTMLYSLISNYARGTNRIRAFAVAGIINTFIMGILNVLLLIYFKMGMNGYFFSMIFGLVVATVYLLITCHIFEVINISSFSWDHFKRLNKYGIPLIPNVLAWWLNSTSDRMFILMFLGASWNGIYSMAGKIPNMLSTLVNIFFQSWQISAVQEYNTKDSKKFITNVFDAFTSFLFFLSILMLTFLRPIFKILVSNAYYTGWKVVPLLLLALIYTSLSGFLGTLYTATKNTMPLMLTTIYGAVINVLLSLVLIKIIGLNGAALANSISFLVVTILRFKDIKKANRIVLNRVNFIYVHVLFFVVFIANYIFSIETTILIGIVVVVIFLLTENSLNYIFKILKKKVKEKAKIGNN